MSTVVPATNSVTISSPPMTSQSGALSIGPLTLTNVASTAEILDINSSSPAEATGVNIPAGCFWVIVVPPPSYAGYWGIVGPSSSTQNPTYLGSGTGILPVDHIAGDFGFYLYASIAGVFELTFF